MDIFGKESRAFSNDSLELSDEQRAAVVEDVAFRYESVMDALKIDWRQDPNAKDTPLRVARALVNELFSGRYLPKPKITQFPNDAGYNGLVFQGDISVTSYCSHHHSPFLGTAYVAYIPKTDGRVIGLSKLNRIVDWYSRRPQLQEALTQQIHDELNTLIDNDGIAVMISCQHSCCSSRGIGDHSTMKTAKLSGAFRDNEEKARDEFYQFINQLKK